MHAGVCKLLTRVTVVVVIYKMKKELRRRNSAVVIAMPPPTPCTPYQATFQSVAYNLLGFTVSLSLFSFRLNSSSERSLKVDTRSDDSDLSASMGKSFIQFTLCIRLYDTHIYSMLYIIILLYILIRHNVALR